MVSLDVTSWVLYFVWAVGVVTVARFVFHILRELWKRLLRPAADLTKYRKDGAWAVVTGASDGIGKAYAEELARRKFPVLLISRTQSKLDALAKELETKYGVKTSVLAVDFTRTDDKLWQEIDEAIKKVGKVSILVNNVGTAYPFPHRFLDYPAVLDRQIIDVNVRAITNMTRLALPRMVERRVGAIINLSSITGTVPTPGLPTYSSTKAYDNFFSLSLSAEYARDGITVQSVTPGLVATAMTRLKRRNLQSAVGMPEDISKGSLDALGYEIHWSPYWPQAVQVWLGKVLPRWYLLSTLLRLGLKSRAFCLQREEERKKTN